MTFSSARCLELTSPPVAVVVDPLADRKSGVPALGGGAVFMVKACILAKLLDELPPPLPHRPVASHPSPRLWPLDGSPMMESSPHLIHQEDAPPGGDVPQTSSALLSRWAHAFWVRAIKVALLLESSSCIATGKETLLHDEDAVELI